jgi:hypothetical protein|tara:strand:- start:532 stop:987 length:456 start_codon:yes stop_codon:yes gene_type:complete
MENIEQTNTDTPDEGGIKELREEYKKLKAENKAYKQNVMNSALNSLGLEADKGIGKAVTKLYDGEVNSEAIAAFVQEEFGEVGAIDAKTEPDTTGNVVQAQSRVEQLQKVGVDNKPMNLMGEFKEYVNSPNTTTKQSISAKLAMMDQDKKS